MNLELFLLPETWVALATLTLLEIVLGIDNLVFIAILTDRLPRAQQPLAYRLGLAGAMITRVGLLLTLNWMMGLEADLITWPVAMSGRDMILLAGGVFLIGKSAHEIYEKVEAHDDDDEDPANPLGKKRASMVWIILQIAVMDIVFSLDSVITAVGMAERNIAVMVLAIMIAVVLMLVFARPIGEFVNRHPSMKLLALSFMLLIGVLLCGEAFGQHLPKAYIYAAMGFSLFVEVLNMRFRKKKKSPEIALATKVADAITERRESKPE
jgi:predicted tellurium resistance membrane protein TerC